MGGGEVLLVILIVAYFIPAVVAARRHHHDAGSIPAAAAFFVVSLVCCAVLLGDVGDSTASSTTFPLVAPEAVIAKYGKPDVVDSTEYDKPRPPMVTKFLTYTKERVRFVFLANGPVGSPPPYRKWRLLGAQDPRGNEPLNADEVERRMAGRKKK
jgi:hypothetical protein